jgi:predicted aspartyl protease
LTAALCLLALLVWARATPTGEEAALAEQVQRWRTRPPASLPDGGSWRVRGSGTVFGSPAEVTFIADRKGRYAFSVQGPVPFVDIFDGETAWKRTPLGGVQRAEGFDRELLHLTYWVLGGYWLAPKAPVLLEPSAAKVPPGQTAVGLRLPEGHLRLTLAVDTATGEPRSLALPGDPPLFQYHLDALAASAPVPARLRYLRAGTELLSLRLGAPEALATGEDPFARPEAHSTVTFRQDSPEITVRANPNGIVYVRPRINGQDAGWFLVDTGAFPVVLDVDLVQRLGLPPLATAQATGVGGSVAIRYHAIESLELGALELRTARVVSMDVKPIGGPGGERLSGILGCQALGRGVLEYDLRHRSLTLHSTEGFAPPAGTEWHPLLLSEGKPVLPVAFEGGTAHFNLDTGASRPLVLGLGLVERLDLRHGRRLRETFSRGVGGQAPAQTGTLSWVDFGGRRFHNVPALFPTHTASALAYPYPEGIVGAPLLDDFRILFDLPRRRIAFLPHRPGLGVPAP